MKTYKFFITILCAFLFVKSARAQNPSMTIQHSGLTPNDTLWVFAGDSIDFIYGGGGVHPMTSGQGSTPSPVFFPTVTVSTSVPMARFALDTVGTYIFHCATNPSNTDNWGTIIVQAANSVQEHTDAQLFTITQDVSRQLLTIQLGNDQGAQIRITDITGRLVSSNANVVSQLQVDLSSFSAGTYIVTVQQGDATSSLKFVR